VEDNAKGLQRSTRCQVGSPRFLSPALVFRLHVLPPVTEQFNYKDMIIYTALDRNRSDVCGISCHVLFFRERLTDAAGVYPFLTALQVLPSVSHYILTHAFKPGGFSC